MRIPPVIRYTTWRLILFAGCAGVLYLVGARGVLLLALAVLVSGLLSFVLLSRSRDAVSATLVRRGEALRGVLESRTRAEDAAAEAWHDAHGTAPPASGPSTPSGDG